MRVALGLVALVIAGGALVLTRGEAASTACATGHAQGFAAIRWSPETVASTIPSRFTGARQFFWRRYNCTGRGVYVRRLDRGVYDISFPGLGYRLAISDAISQEGVLSSVQPFGTGVFRVVLRGPLSEQGVVIRRDTSFAIVVY